MPDPTAAVLREALGRLPRVPLARSLRRSRRHHASPPNRVGRESSSNATTCPASPFGGSKASQMEYFVGAARAAGADVLIGGGNHDQPNHARGCAAWARVAGMIP